MSTNTIVGVIVLILLLAGGYWFYTKDTAMQNSAMLANDGLEVAGANVFYFEQVQGFYAHPTAEGEYPGVVMIHEWWGLNQNIKDMALELAKQGYRVLAVDLFGTVAATPEEARTQVGALDQEEALSNLMAAVGYLKDKGAHKVASLGWCFGGGQSLRLSTAGVEALDATVVYYGSLVTSTDALQNIHWPVLGIFGETDTSIPTTSVREFESNLTSLGIKNEVIIYPGVGHAFANPSGMNYAPEATRDAWAKTLSFLEANLK